MKKNLFFLCQFFLLLGLLWVAGYRHELETWQMLAMVAVVVLIRFTEAFEQRFG